MDAPRQIADGLADAAREGKLFTCIVCVAVFVHPLALVTVTVYVVVTLGDTKGEPLKLPGCQVFVIPPVAFNTEVLPEQIALGTAVVESVGKELIATVKVAVFEHPPALVAVTVYVVVIVGETVGEPVKFPGCQV